MYFDFGSSFFGKLRPKSAVRAAARSLIRESIESLGDATCWEIEERLNMCHQSVSARICELRKLGFIEDTGMRRLTNYKRPARVYKIKAQDGAA